MVLITVIWLPGRVSYDPADIVTPSETKQEFQSWINGTRASQGDGKEEKEKQAEEHPLVRGTTPASRERVYAGMTDGEGRKRG